MATAVWIMLAVVSIGVLVLAFSLYATVGAATLNRPEAIAHDGPRTGRSAPPFEAVTTSGEPIAIPNRRPGVLLFVDHSLVDFPDLLEFLVSELSLDVPDLLVVGADDATTADVLSGLGLRVPATLVPRSVYDRYRIRVMPYAVVVDRSNRVVASGLVNTAYQLRRLAQAAGALDPAGSAPTTTTQARGRA